MSALLQADGLSFRYDRDVPLVEEWSAEFHPGEVVAVTGPSGRGGKSTLLYLLGSC